MGEGHVLPRHACLVNAAHGCLQQGFGAFSMSGLAGNEPRYSSLAVVWNVDFGVRCSLGGMAPALLMPSCGVNGGQWSQTIERQKPD